MLSKKYISYILMYFFFIGCQVNQTTAGFVVNDTIDLGTVSSSDTVNFVVNVKNPTDEAVQIVNIQGTCGCVKVKVYPSVVEPHQDGIINATYYSIFDKKSAGALEKTLVLRLDKKPFIHSVKLTVKVR